MTIDIICEVKVAMRGMGVIRKLIHKVDLLLLTFLPDPYRSSEFMRWCIYHKTEFLVVDPKALFVQKTQAVDAFDV